MSGFLFLYAWPRAKASAIAPHILPVFSEGANGEDQNSPQTRNETKPLSFYGKLAGYLPGDGQFPFKGAPGQVIRRRLIQAAFWLSKTLGLFALARRFTRSDLRVLCYHGFALDDEHRFRRSLFITRRNFARRMAHLHRQGYRVLPLDEANRRRQQGSLPPDAVTITIDDGFYSTHAIAGPILARYGFPSTLYLTSYYFQKGTPIFQLAVDYICWKSPHAKVDLSGLGVPALEGAGAIAFDAAIREDVSDIIHAHGSAELDEPGRVALSRRLAERLSVDYDRIADSRMLSLVSPHELRDLHASGMRIGLHTHRHILPTDTAGALRELEENRAAIAPLIGQRLTDFCYPSGLWSDRHRPALRAAGIATATTCESGLSSRGHDSYLLPRILDDERISMIEFEAEISGFCEVLRKLRARTHRHAVAMWHAAESLPGWVAPALSI